MTSAARKTAVSIPGGATAEPLTDPLPGTTEQLEQLQALGGGEGGPQSGTEIKGTPGDVAELQAQLQALLAENAELKKRGTKKTDASDVVGASAVSHRHLRQDQVDPKKLTSPVLCADGWVVPDDSDKKAAK